MVGEDGELVEPATFLYIAERFGLAGRRSTLGWSAVRSRSSRRRRSSGSASQVEVNLSGLSLTSPEVLTTIEHELGGDGDRPQPA